MMNKRDSRLRRAKRTRMKIRELEAIRLCVHKTSKHMYAQLTSSDGNTTMLCASTLDKELKEKLKSTGNASAAKEVGKLLAVRAVAAGFKTVAFDRSGYSYHGRIKALADGAREAGLEF
jgi:large subunit ribosomal protein L18